MSIALDIFLFFSSITMLFVAVLSVATGVGGCEWPIASRPVCMEVYLWKLSKFLLILLPWLIP